MDTLLQDLRYALRALRRAPGFAAVAIVTLGLGIGANTAVFSLVNAVFLRPLPSVDRPERLVRIFGGERAEGGPRNPLSYPVYQDLAAAPGVFAGVAVAGPVQVARDAAGPVVARVVSGNYFAVLGLRPAVGRGLTAADDTPGARPAVVVSHDFWLRELGGRADVARTTLSLNGQTFAVVGVAPAGFRGTDVEARVEVWIPVRQLALLHGGRQPAHGSLTDRGSRWLFPVARLRDGATPDQAAGALAAVASRLQEQHPEVHRDFQLRALPGGTLVSAAGAPQVLMVFTLLLVVVGAVLCVACANVANLLLARAASRRREIAVRLSLGAGRARLLRQLLTESLVLATLGGALGLALAQLAPMLFGLLELPPTFDFSLDARVLAHAFGISLLTGVIFGLAPALQAVRGGSAEALRDGSPGAGRSRSRLRTSLTAAQVALSLALLIAASLLLRSLWALQSARVPYDESRVAVAFADASQAGPGPAERRAALEGLRRSLAGIAGVEAVALGGMVPMGDFREETPWRAGPEGAVLDAQVSVVSTPYFDVLGLPVRAGRAFTAGDRAGSAPVAVVNQAMAAALWPGRSPLGQRIRSAGGEPRDYEVVGVAQDIVYARHAGVQPTVYLAWEQSDRSDGILHLRLRPGATGVEPAVQEAARGSGVAVFGVRTLTGIRRDAAFPQRLTGVLLGVFGGLALVLATVGLYGVVSYSAAQRTHEIGVRIALGARPRAVRRLIVGQGVRMAAIGVGAGVVLALGLSRMLRTLLFGVGATDPLTYAAAATLLLLVAGAASWVPALRASRLEPMRALRSE